MPDAMDVVAAAIKDAGDNSGATLRILKITEVGTGTTAGKVRTDATGQAWLAVDAGVTVAVGQRVYALQQGSVTVVAGSLGGQTVTTVEPPVGAVTPYAGATAPARWLICDGALLLRADYPDLFAVIGTTYGTTLATNFRLPDLRGRDVIGVETGKARGATGGQESVTLTGAMTPVHDHGASQSSHAHTVDIAHGHTATQTGHTHNTIADHTHTRPSASNVTAASGTAVTAKAGAAGTTINTHVTGASGGHTHSSVSPAITVADAAGTPTTVSRTPAVTVDPTATPTAAVPVLDPYVAMPYIIRAV